MPCNLSVTITKAAVTDEALLSLLDSASLAAVIETYLSQASIQTKPTAARTFDGDVVTATVIDNYSRVYSIHVERGVVTVYAPASARALANQLQNEIATLVSRYAAQAFARRVQASVEARLGASVTAAQVDVEQDGQVVPATVLTFSL